MRYLIFFMFKLSYYVQIKIGIGKYYAKNYNRGSQISWKIKGFLN